MFIDYLLSNFEIFTFISICFIVVGFLLLFFFQYKNQHDDRSLFVEQTFEISKDNKDIKEYLVVIGNLLDQQKKEITKILEKMVFLEREINRLGEIKGSEDMLSVAIEMARGGSSKEDIKNQTSLRDDEVEAIYTYYKK
jgi:hypothetical protein